MNVVFLIIAVLGFLLIIKLLIRKDVDRLPQLLLASFYLIFSIYALQTYIINANLLEKFTWFYFWPLVLYSLIMVPSYFYFIVVIKDGFKWKWTYVLIFVPVLLGVVDVVNVYIQPASFYDQIVQEAITKSASRFGAQYGFLSLNEHFIIRHGWQFIYMISLLPLLRSFLAIKSSDRSKKLLNIWLLVFFISLTLMASMTTFFGLERRLGLNFFHLESSDLFRIHLAFYVVLLVISIMPLYFPSILYGYPQVKESKEPDLSLISTTNVITATPTNLDLKFGLNTEALTENLKSIEEQGLFLQQDFSLSTCSQLLNIQPHHLSYYLNQHRNLSFSEYRNHVRIDKAKLLLSLGFLDKNTVEALALQCGFANRSSFSKNFKKVTHMNVTEFTSKS